MKGKEGVRHEMVMIALSGKKKGKPVRNKEKGDSRAKRRPKRERKMGFITCRAKERWGQMNSKRREKDKRKEGGKAENRAP